ncbi:hypothetical protein [Actinomadura hibisca]|uniref:hypothetical protein n=1 Tax=Actinomadura hibisca TaxID=68565 RepID=UPI000AA7ABD7|nr:hypothetical protein [Actinomadura hibisca]
MHAGGRRDFAEVVDESRPPAVDRRALPTRLAIMMVLRSLVLFALAAVIMYALRGS